jgi:hypothetical protein
VKRFKLFIFIFYWQKLFRFHGKLLKRSFLCIHLSWKAANLRMHLKNRSTIHLHVYGPCLFYSNVSRRKSIVYVNILYKLTVHELYKKKAKAGFTHFTTLLFLLGGRRDCMWDCGVWGVSHQICGGVRDTLQGEVLYRVWARVHYRWVYRLRSVSPNTWRSARHSTRRGALQSMS